MIKPLMTDAEVAEARARCDAATPPPWKRGFERACNENYLTIPTELEYNSPIDRIDDIDFIIGARTDLPRALDTIDALWEMLKKLAGEHTAGCASQRTGRYHNLIEVQPMCNCPCGEIAKLLGGE